jgi:hypothetical protein
MKTLSLVSLVLMLAASPVAMAQSAPPPEASAAVEQPLTAKEVKEIRARIRKLEFEVTTEVSNALRGFGRTQDRNDPRVSRDTTNFDRRGRPRRDAVPVTATHQKLLIELKQLDEQLRAAGISPES